MKAKKEFIYPDYEKIRKESRRIDCTITEADFNTSCPNPYRINVTAGDINRYLKCKTGGNV